MALALFIVHQQKIKQFPWLAKDELGLRMPGVYRISCEHGLCYIGPADHTVEECCKEHQKCLCLYNLDKSAVAQHSTETGHKDSVCGDYSFI